jgi:L-ascorbate metabolism protein UlaG (beta-lactamase superfamily)
MGPAGGIAPPRRRLRSRNGHCKLLTDAASLGAREPLVIRITWYGHACFRLETPAAALVTDPYTPAEAGLEPVPEPADAVVMSSALDTAHSCAAMVPGSPAVFNALEYVGRRTEIADGVWLEAVAASEGADRPDDPKANALYLLELGGHSVCHMGDVGTPLAEEQVAPFRGRVDVLLALAGGGQTIPLPDLHAAVRELRPRVVVPMHYATPSLRYRCGPVEDFLSAYAPEEVVWHDSSALELDGVAPGPVIHVLRPLLDPAVPR